MSSDGASSNDLPPVADIEALMASAEWQAQMQAMTQQAMAGLRALLEAMNTVSLPPDLSMVPIDPPPLGSEPVLVGPPFISPPDPVPEKFGGDLARSAVEPQWSPLAVLTTEEVGAEMLAILPQPSVPAVVAEPVSAATDDAASGLAGFAAWDEGRFGGEGSAV